MARPRRRALQPSDIEGLEYFDTLVPLLARLKDFGTQRDRAGNRQLFYDQYVCLLLLYFFSPTITSTVTVFACFFPVKREEFADFQGLSGYPGYPTFPVAISASTL